MNPYSLFATPYSLLPPRLLQDGAELHGEAHVARDAQLALHEGGGAVEFAFDHLLEGLEGDRDRAVGALALSVAHRVGRRLSVDEDRAGLAEIEFERSAQAGIVADGGSQLGDDLLDLRRGGHGGSFPWICSASLYPDR